MQLTLTIDGQRLIFWGAVLFLVGLLQGVLIPGFENPRMALSAHLAAVQGGMVLMIFGVIWSLVLLGPRWLKAAHISAVASMYLIWSAITLAALLGASKALPIAGKGYAASPMQELVVQAIVLGGGMLGIVSSILLVTGLARSLRTKVR